MFHTQVHNLAFRIATRDDADRYIVAVVAALRDIYGLEQDAEALRTVWDKYTTQKVISEIRNLQERPETGP